MADSSKKISLNGKIGMQKAEVAINDQTAQPDDPFPSDVSLTVTADGKTKRISFNEDVALSVSVGDQKRHITFKELTLSNNFALEALVKLLVDNKLIDVKDLQQTMDKIRQERYQMPGQNPKGN
jgi:hypothetical protein